MNNNLNDGFIQPGSTPEKKIDNISKIIGTGPDTIKIIPDFMPYKDRRLFLQFGKMSHRLDKTKTHHYTINAVNIDNIELQSLFLEYENKSFQYGCDKIFYKKDY